MGSLSDWGTFLLCWFANKSTPLTSKRCAFHYLLGPLSEEAGSESKSLKWVLKPFTFDHHPLTYFFRTKHTDSPFTSVLVREAGLLRKCPLPYIHRLPSKLNSIATEEKCLCITQGRKHATHNTQTVVRCIKTKTRALSLFLPSINMPRNMGKGSSELERWLWLDPQTRRPEFLSQHPHPTPTSQGFL